MHKEINVDMIQRQLELCVAICFFLIPLMVYSEIVGWIFDTFDNNFEK